MEAQTAQDKALHVIVDNDATDKHETVRNWLKRNTRVVLHFIPTSSSWLNRVERFVALITEKRFWRGVFSSVTELEDKIKELIDANNENPKPFVWTKTTDVILEKIARAKATLI